MPRVVDITPEELNELHAEYQRNGSIRRLAARRGLNYQTLSNRFKAAGLPFAKRKPTQKLKISAEKIAAMHALYMTGQTLREVGAQFGHGHSAVRNMFVARNLPVRDGNPGQYAPLTPRTDTEIEELIAKATRVMLPHELSIEWGKWPLTRRAWFVRRLRERLPSPHDRPEFPFSSNVEPFDYGSEHVHAIVERVNAGTTSQTAKIKLNLASQGVIYRERVYFWTSYYPTGGGAYYAGTYREGRVALHRVIWEEHFGAIPPSHIVRRHDGNSNNFAPANLYLQHRADAAGENSRAAKLIDAKEKTAALLQRFQNKESHHGNSNDEPLNHLVGSREARMRAKAAAYSKARGARRKHADVQGA